MTVALSISGIASNNTLIRNGPANMQVLPFNNSGTQSIAGVSKKTIRIWMMLFAPIASCTLNISDGATSMTGDMTLTGLLLSQGNLHWYEATAGAAINFACSGNMVGTVWYTQD